MLYPAIPQLLVWASQAAACMTGSIHANVFLVLCCSPPESRRHPGIAAALIAEAYAAARLGFISAGTWRAALQQTFWARKEALHWCLWWLTKPTRRWITGANLTENRSQETNHWTLTFPPETISYSNVGFKEIFITGTNVTADATV